MRFLLKLLALPVIIVLTPVIRLCFAALYCSSWIFGLASGLVSLLGVVGVIGGDVKNGIIILVMAALISPVGIPLLAAHALGGLQSVVLALKDFIRG